MSDYILTYSKIKFYPLKPIKDDIKIIDVAHALSLITRANGHFKHFYSVAQHSINCYKEAKIRDCSERVQLGCLLHDASEAYISDLTRPVKGQLTEYFTIEEKLQKTIYEWFGIGDLTEDELKKIKDIDDTLLYFEFQELMGISIFDKAPDRLMDHDFSQREFTSAENDFISAFNKLTGLQKDYSCVGIDGCEGKWVAVCITESGYETGKFNTISDICKRYPYADTMIIDMPIGLPESLKDVRPDRFVKKVLGKKGSSLFEVPCRQAVYSVDKETARTRNIAVLGKSLSEQSLAISKAIRQVDEFLQENSQWKNRLIESHPEFCFSKLNNNCPVLEKKTTEEGQQIRLEILKRYYSEAECVIEKYLSDVPFRKKKDDVIDALCLAVTGKLILENGLKRIPENPMMDEKGLLMQMVYGMNT